MKYIVTMNGKQYEVGVERYSPFHMLTHEEVAGGVPEKAVQPVQPTPQPQPAVPQPQPAAQAPSAGGKEILCPMSGSILTVKVSVGQSVNVGDTVFIMEAMKMETEIVAPESGVIASIEANAGDAVEADQVLAHLR